MLYGYWSAVCMTFSPAVFILILQQQISITKIYNKDVQDDELLEKEQMIVRVDATHKNRCLGSIPS